jgi:hypothetical protein
MKTLSTSLMLLLSLSTPAVAEANREAPTPERVYRQLREQPVIRTREEALEVLAEASRGALWRSAKFCVDRRIKDLLSHPGFEALDEEIQSKLHASMLEIRQSFWAEDLQRLSSAEEALRQLWERGEIVSTAENREVAERLQDRLLRLVEEVEMAAALQECAREAHPQETVDYLECLLRGGPDD